jgi:hypothetical protein
MRIYTVFDEASRSAFDRIKRKKKSGWKFLVAGEWGQSPMHSGNVTFLYSHTDDQRFWALLERGFPKRIVAVADAGPSCVAESVIGEMLRAVREGGGSYIGGVNSATDEDIDFEDVWDIYWPTKSEEK